MVFNELLAAFRNNLMPILLIGGAGFFLGKGLAVDARSLGRVAFYIFSPILVFNLLVHTELSVNEIFTTAVYSIGVALGSGLLAFILGKMMGFTRPLLIAIVLTAALGNTGNYGLPLVSFAFGEEALAFATLYFVTNVILFNTAGVLIASLGHMDFRTALGGLFKVPAVYAVVLALLLNRFHVVMPLFLERTIGLAADGSIPILIVLLGLELARVQWSHSVRAVSLSVGIRLLAGPLIGLLLAAVFGLEGAARRGNVIETAMPAAVTNVVLATEYGLDVSLVTAMVSVGTLLSPLTLTPLLVYLGK